MNSRNQKLRKDDCFNTNHANRDPDCVRILTLPLSLSTDQPLLSPSFVSTTDAGTNVRAPDSVTIGIYYRIFCCRHRTDAGAYILRPACEL